ncbi:helix-turn-helix transcriptional regulator [Comamonas aquatica]|uniref:helix-turn-helix transcriptional regulator n=1 Tax=Comamonas aquatica TaxID=225991 RepID=UPI0021B0A9D6|nr:AlpA family phage regulatory protein [Comamonas aquatica]
MNSIARAARPKQVADILGIGIATLWRWAKTRDDFPKPRHLSARCTVFDLQEIIEWRDAQVAQPTKLVPFQKNV